MNKSHPIHINIPITKVDEELRMVWGYATVEEVDAHGEIIGYEASKAAFSNWVGNIREMHGPVAIGKGVEIQFDDDAKGVWLGSKISESADGENAWIKVKEGILQAYSIGGTIQDFEMVTGDDDVEHLMVTKYELFETSLVDNPACPSATLQVVKSMGGGDLRRVEKTSKGTGLQPAWWASRFNFTPNAINKSSAMPYNKDSMNESKTLAKGIWEAYELVDLASCLSSYIWWKTYENEDVPELKAALTAIQAAAAEEILEPVEFPAIEIEIENALTALNIKKKEELKKMTDEKNKIEKGGIAPVDGDPRDNAATTVAEVTTQAAVKPANQKVPKKVYAADGKTVTTKATDAAEEAPAADAAIEKSTTPDANGDLVKAILAGVDASIAKAVEPLKAEIDELKSKPALSKRATTYMDVDKVEDKKTEETDTKAEFDSLMVKAEEFAADPNHGTLQERMAVGVKLRKLSRQMDPASQAQHAAIKASFTQQQ